MSEENQRLSLISQINWPEKLLKLIIKHVRKMKYLQW
jgi:hypothetical protein